MSSVKSRRRYKTTILTAIEVPDLVGALPSAPGDNVGSSSGVSVVRQINGLVGVGYLDSKNPTTDRGQDSGLSQGDFERKGLIPNTGIILVINDELPGEGLFRTDDGDTILRRLLDIEVFSVSYVPDLPSIIDTDGLPLRQPTKVSVRVQSNKNRNRIDFTCWFVPLWRSQPLTTNWIIR